MFKQYTSKCLEWLYKNYLKYVGVWVKVLKNIFCKYSWRIQIIKTWDLLDNKSQWKFYLDNGKRETSWIITTLWKSEKYFYFIIWVVNWAFLLILDKFECARLKGEVLLSTGTVNSIQCNCCHTMFIFWIRCFL